MKRYLLFEFDDYTQSGGMDDLIGSFDHLKEIELKGHDWDYCQLFDCEKRELLIDCHGRRAFKEALKELIDERD